MNTTETKHSYRAGCTCHDCADYEIMFVCRECGWVRNDIRDACPFGHDELEVFDDTTVTYLPPVDQ